MSHPPSDDPSAPWPPLHPDTLMVRGGLDRSGHRETSEALYLTSGYVYDDAAEAEAAFDGTRERFVYSRLRNPTVQMFERRLAALEGAGLPEPPDCKAVASGMAAITAAVLCQVMAGDRVVAARELFGSCTWVLKTLLPRYGVSVDLVPVADRAAWAEALSRPARAVFLETPSNPTLRLADLAAIADLARRAGARLIVDNAFATPVLQRPFALGADIVVHSATKWIDGQGRCLGGAILSRDPAFVADHLTPFLRHTGPCLSPFNAWVLVKGLETLGLRMARHSASALALARQAAAHPAVAAAHYPGLGEPQAVALAESQMAAGGGIFALSLRGGRAAAFRFLDALRVMDISNNLGDAKTLACHPATTTHQSLSAEDKQAQGIDDGLIRLSVGLEHPDDLARDLANALAAANAGEGAAD